jgi:4-hydroxybenzoate polyprenyltransferase
MLGAMVAVSLLYVGGMYLNDWRDASYDREHRPERPIPSRLISRNAVLFYALVYFVVAGVITAFIQPASLWWVLGLIVCITAYDLHHKKNSMSPWVMAGCRALIYPWAASLTGQGIPVELWIAAGAAYSYTLGLTYVARGPAKSLAFQVTMVTCILLPAILWATRLGGHTLWLGLLILVVFLGWVSFSLRGWLCKPPRIGFAVGHLIAGFFFVDLLAITIATSANAAIVLAFTVLFIATVKIQTIISGT